VFGNATQQPAFSIWQTETTCQQSLRVHRFPPSKLQEWQDIRLLSMSNFQGKWVVPFSKTTERWFIKSTVGKMRAGNTVRIMRRFYRTTWEDAIRMEPIEWVFVCTFRLPSVSRPHSTKPADLAQQGAVILSKFRFFGSFYMIFSYQAEVCYQVRTRYPVLPHLPALSNCYFPKRERVDVCVRPINRLSV
jgi:hypothetical protein